MHFASWWHLLPVSPSRPAIGCSSYCPFHSSSLVAAAEKGWLPVLWLTLASSCINPLSAFVPLLLQLLPSLPTISHSLYCPLPFLMLTLSPQLLLPKTTCCSSLLLLPSSLPHTHTSSSPVATAEKDALPVLCQLSDPCIYFILPLACCSNYYQSFHLLPSSLPHAHSSSSSVATAKNDPLLVSPHLALTHCPLSFAVTPTAILYQPSDPCIYFILLLACRLNHCQSFPLLPFPLPHTRSSSSSVAAAEKDSPPVLR
jgi:hypothetical protein